MNNESKFQLEVHAPFETFTAGAPTPIPYVIDGLLAKSAFSVLGAKAKHGKSSMSRIEAVAIAKGASFLERAVERGEVLLCSLEDPLQHVDNCLRVLNYDPAADARIHIVTKLPGDVGQTVDILSDYLQRNPNIKLVVLDTLAKVLRAKDSGNYDEMLSLCEHLHDISRQHPVHIQALHHCKKVQPDDPFDGFLGSVEVRAETDTNIVLFDRNGDRLIRSETRMGTPWEATVINAETATIGNSQMVKRFWLGDTFEKTVARERELQTQTTKMNMESRLVRFLKERNGRAMVSDYMENVTGGNTTKSEVMHDMVKQEIIRLSGKRQSKTNPLTIHLEDGPALESVLSPVLPAPEPVSEFFVCNYRDCTNQVPRKDGYCYLHPNGSLCVN